MKTSSILKTVLRPIRDERGVVLVITMLVVALLLLLAGHFMTSSLTEHTIAANNVNAARAFYLADAGTEHARKTLETLNLSQVLDGTTTVFAAGSSVILPDGSYTVQLTNNNAANGFPRGVIPADSKPSRWSSGLTTPLPGFLAR
jgi:Tfp pilus assembly protein PilX